MFHYTPAQSLCKPIKGTEESEWWNSLQSRIEADNKFEQQMYQSDLDADGFVATFRNRMLTFGYSNSPDGGSTDDFTNEIKYAGQVHDVLVNRLEIAVAQKQWCLQNGGGDGSTVSEPLLREANFDLRYIIHLIKMFRDLDPQWYDEYLQRATTALASNFDVLVGREIVLPK